MAVAMLQDAPDADLIGQAEARYHEQVGKDYEGFEVWDGARFVYRYPEDLPQPSASHLDRKT